MISEKLSDMSRARLRRGAMFQDESSLVFQFCTRRLESDSKTTNSQLLSKAQSIPRINAKASAVAGLVQNSLLERIAKTVPGSYFGATAAPAASSFLTAASVLLILIPGGGGGIHLCGQKLVCTIKVFNNNSRVAR
ncbi:hypothetical protein PanWU01x14_039280 [Parasponia andersonii]|uniref:Uncharacterized protein n=1 Tax=Parasponia andersonii TaxID=3476 RepID=A0A2P5DQV9_PARAD|nr:hypothetical protein PanWU01x14_039280 [Parasponia andersonii]